MVSIVKGLHYFAINHLLPCRSKPVKASFIFGTQSKIYFFAFWELSNPPIDNDVINKINIQKQSKEIWDQNSYYNFTITNLWLVYVRD